MKRMVMALLCLFVVFACSKKETESTSSHAGHSHEEQSSEQPKQMIPDTEDETALAAIKPYFDENGTVTEKSISPGDRFDVFVFAEYEESESMSAAEYKLILPEGINIMASFETDSTTLQSGQPLKDFMIAFRCNPGPRAFLVKYTCLAGPDFAGGSIQTAAGDRSKFIGLVTCGHSPKQFTAEHGQAVLTIISP
jgi:hypothetical protein